MNQLTTPTDQFSFLKGGLAQQLLEAIRAEETGYWKCQFESEALTTEQGGEDRHWQIGIVNGRIIYSGGQIWSVESLIELLDRYVPHTRNALVKPRFDLLKAKVSESVMTPAQLLAEAIQVRIIDAPQLLKALRTKVLNDLDIYLLTETGSATFSPTPDLATQLPFVGFELVTLLAEAERRQSIWKDLEPQVPSMDFVPMLDRDRMKAKVPPGQIERIEGLVAAGGTLNSIAASMAKDSLEIAEMFAKLVRVGVVKFPLAPVERLPITIMAIDDSPVMLSQFENLVSGMGYNVVACQDAAKAIETIFKVKPAMIFIDLNMPEISGFELIKQIRQQPQSAQIPLVILTGEQKVSNRWRAQWSGCEFLVKPLSTDAIDEFQLQHAALLTKQLKLSAAVTN